mgnify:CR=1 FL=1
MCIRDRYRSEHEEQVDVLRIDNAEVKAAQIAKLERLKAERDSELVKTALAALTKAADTGDGNLLALAIDAGRAKATVGEISLALELAYGRHKAEIRSVNGVYSSEVGDDTEAVNSVRDLVEQFAAREGRRPRILVAKMGQDGHDRGQKVIATAFADLGFDVDIGPLFQTPEEAAKQAIENDVHILGVSTQAAAHKTLVPMLIDSLKEENAENILVVCGGIIPDNDIPELESMGVGAVFGPGTNISKAALKVLDLIQ